MKPENWSDPNARSVALFIDGATDPDVGADGTPLVDDDFLFFVNAWWEPLSFQLPADVTAGRWKIVCDTFDSAGGGVVDGSVDVGARSILLLSAPNADRSAVQNR